MDWNKNKILSYLKQLVSLGDAMDVQAAATSIRENIHFRGPNVFILFFAIIIASVGLNVNSIPVIIGAMLISPLMGPIIGFGMGLGTNDMTLVKDALKNLAVMVGISIIASTLYFLVSPLDMDNPTELLARTNPTIYDVFIALFGGFAGIMETSRKERGTVMSGVAIATALMPPLCTVGYGIAIWNWHYAFGALYLFLINGILIALATFLTVKYLHYPVVEEQSTNAKRRAWSIALVVVVLVVPSVISAISVVRENQFASHAKAFIASNKTIGTSYVYQTEVKPSQGTIEFFLAGEALTDADRKLFYASALKAGFDSTAIVLHENALTRDDSDLRQDQLVRDLFASKEEQIAAYQQQITELRTQLAAAEVTIQQVQKRPTLPTQQLTEEIKAQYPQVAQVTLAEGELLVSTDSSSVLQPVTIVSLQLQPKKRLQQADREKMEEWLRVRLKSEHVDLRVR